MRFQKATHCLNCGFDLQDANYCPECGQANTDRKLTLWQFIRDFVDDYFTFDSRFFHSVGPLITKPGHITREYLDGRRIRYILPLRLYLFTTFLFFFIIAINSKWNKEPAVSQVQKVASRMSAASMDTVSAVFQQHSTEISPELQSLILESMEAAQNEAAKPDSSNIQISFGDSDKSNNRFVKYLTGKARYLQSKGSEGGDILFKEMVNQIPKIMFILLPLFAFFLKLLYFRRKMLYVEHLIFSLHYHTFAFLVLILAVIFPKWFIIIPVILLILVQMFRALRKVYQQSIIKTIFKMWILLTLYVFSILPALAVLMILAVVSI
jgi:hypothetical protein